MKLLIAEDEKELATALGVIFKHNNYTVDIVNDGQEAIDYLMINTYDCIILDIMMPYVDGIGVLKKLRSNNIKTPVILLTAKSQVEDKVYGLDCGADDYLAKPFEIKELLARIRALTRRGIDTKDNIIEFGNTKLDMQKFTISVNYMEESLASKEYQILEYLMKNPKRLVNLNELYDRIWSDSDSYDNVVWVYISYIRKKLNKINSNICIKAKRNIGYQLELL